MWNIEQGVMMSIYADALIVLPPSDDLPGGSKQVCVLFQNGTKTLSVALNDSQGAHDALRRGDIQCRDEGKDVTDDVFNSLTHRYRGKWDVCANLDNFAVALNWLRRSKWGLSG